MDALCSEKKIPLNSFKSDKEKELNRTGKLLLQIKS